MTIKFEKETRRLKTMICLSGRLQARHLEELKRQMEGTRSRIALDLNGVTLVVLVINGLLNAWENRGVVLLNYWPNIRNYMRREKGREG